eukprot:CAMPEP_0174265540 /NCGR_PEP_ID=MMETSP0439-20130205/26864_1 /TAXON_ID=0 /ORGANISM="Stereomyxa ramosa, Strain Chinc5" /LENGTH=333 /DNA_ID=CAMNT_0015352051 /DNA_START=104 /DNA_END=1105 /DNA_ORIENTATION=+
MKEPYTESVESDWSISEGADEDAYMDAINPEEEDESQYLEILRLDLGAHTQNGQNIECDSSERYNVIIFGKHGAGKSSLINTANWAMHPHLSFKEARVANVRTSKFHEGTSKYKPYKIGSKMELHDTRGLMTMLKDEEDNVYLQIVGRAKPDQVIAKIQKKTWFQYVMNRAGTYDYDKGILRKPSAETMPHCIIICVAANERIPVYVDTIIRLAGKDAKTPVLFVLTKVDLVNEKEVKQKKNYLKAHYPNMEGKIKKIKNYEWNLIDDDPDNCDSVKPDEARNIEALEIMRLARNNAIHWLNELADHPERLPPYPEDRKHAPSLDHDSRCVLY